MIVGESGILQLLVDKQEVLRRGSQETDSF